MSSTDTNTKEPDPQIVIDAVSGSISKKYYVIATLHLICKIPSIYLLWKQACAFRKKKFPKVLMDMFMLIWRYHGILVMFHGINCFIEEYFAERLHEVGHTIENYMLAQEVADIFWVSSSHDIANIRKIDNKISGYNFLTKHNLPTTTRYGMIYVKGENVIWEDQQKNVLSVNDLLNKYRKVFTKPEDECVGRGCAILEKGLSGGILFNATEIGERELAKYLKKPQLIEEIVEQTSECASWHPQSLNTLRIITMRNPKTRELYVDRAIFRLGTGSSHTDNWCSGGIGVKVNANGKLDKYGYYSNPAIPPATMHPDSNKIFENAELPYYNEAVELVLRAHRIIRRINGIGWDVAFTKRGPIIVEINPFFSIFQAQCGGIRKKVYEDYLPQAIKNASRWAELESMLKK